jgi:maltose alpha-D-glucosyltransferase/alpha-amylase
VIEEAEYSYQKVNVAQQISDPESLLNQMRRLIRLRKENPVFALGTLRFLDDVNRSILAFERTYKNISMLVLHNLVDTRQACSLNLSHLSEQTPVDILDTQITYTQVGSEEYTLSLNPFQSLWLHFPTG